MTRTAALLDAMPVERIVKRFKDSTGTLGLPAISVLGPRFAGKSECLREVEDRLKRVRAKTESPRSLLIDLENLGTRGSAELAAHLLDRMYAELNAPVRLRPGATEEWNNFPFAESLRHFASQVESSTVILIDHIDTVSVDFARALVRAFRVVFDQRGVYPEYKRLGVVFAGSISLSQLRRSGESSFISQVVVLPSVNTVHQDRAIRQTWPDTEGLTPAQAHDLSALTRGEKTFIDIVRQKWPTANGGGRSKLADTITATSDHIIFRELAIALFTDDELWRLVEEVSDQGDGMVARRDFTPDCDIYALSGVLVTTGTGTQSQTYAFRNEIVRSFVAKLRRWRQQPDPVQLPQATRALLDELEDSAALFRTVPDIWDAMDGLRRLWRLLGEWKSLDDLHVHLSYQSGLSYWLSHKSGVRTDAVGVPAAAREAVEAAQNGEIHTLGFGYDKHQVSVAQALANDRATLVVVVSHPKSELRSLREHTLARWQRILIDRERPLLASALAEASYVLAAAVGPSAGAPAPQDRQPAPQASAPGLPRVDRELLKQLADRIAAVGYAQGVEQRQYLDDLLNRAPIPDEWKMDASSLLTAGNWSAATWRVIRWLEEKGSIPGFGTSALATILVSIAPSFGQEDRVLFIRVIEAIQNPADEELRTSMRTLIAGGDEGPS